jgi:hypothetical protein
MQIVEDIGQFFFVYVSCGSQCTDKIIVTEHPGRQRRFFILGAFQKGNFADGALIHLMTIHFQVFTSLEADCVDSQ